MHGSGSSLHETAAVRLYLDESGSEDPGTPLVSVGGILINSSKCEPFESDWEDLLAKYSIESPLHMKEFGRHGRFFGITRACRYKLFCEVSELINFYKLYSIAANISYPDYQKTFDREIRNLFGIYGMCYLMLVEMNHILAERNKHPHQIPFIFDDGNPKQNHVLQAHSEISKMQIEGGYFHLGRIHFENDRDFGVLQAADVIAWGTRRRISRNPFGLSFAPIERILDKATGHAEADWQAEWMKELNETLMKKYREENEKPKT